MTNRHMFGAELLCGCSSAKGLESSLVLQDRQLLRYCNLAHVAQTQPPPTALLICRCGSFSYRRSGRTSLLQVESLEPLLELVLGHLVVGKFEQGRPVPRFINLSRQSQMR